MHWDSPVAVELDAKVSRLIAHYSEPAMLTPVGAPAAKPRNPQQLQKVYNSCLTHVYIYIFACIWLHIAAAQRHHAESHFTSYTSGACALDATRCLSLTPFQPAMLKSPRVLKHKPGVQHRPVPTQPVWHIIFLPIALHSNDMHLLCALTGVIVDASSVSLKLRGDTYATCYRAACSNLSHHCLLPCHLTYRHQKDL